MKRVLFIMMVLFLLAGIGCGKSQQAKAADQLILDVGTVTESSGSAIDKAEGAVAALNEKELASLENLDKLKAARAEYDKLIEEKKRQEEEERKRKEEEEKQRREDMEAAQVAIDAINEIGDLAYDSGEKIAAARNAYDSLEARQQAYVSNYETLVYDEEHLSEVKVATAIELIDKLGEVTYPDGEPLKPIQAVYKLMSEEERARVTNEKKYLEQIDNYNRGLAKTMVKKVKVWATSGRTVELYFNFVNANEKTIKYITFGVRFKNSVGDIVKYKKNSNEVYCDLTGPYKTGEGLSGSYWRWTFYSSELDTWEVASVELTYLQIEYMDGTKSYLSGDSVRFLYE